VQLDCSLAALQADLLFTPVNTCSAYSLEALQANFEDPFLEPPTVVVVVGGCWRLLLLAVVVVGVLTTLTMTLGFKCCFRATSSRWY
jgi:hypothetical protein